MCNHKLKNSRIIPEEGDEISKIMEEFERILEALERNTLQLHRIQKNLEPIRLNLKTAERIKHKKKFNEF